MNADELSRFDELISHYLDGVLAEAEAAELLALLADPPLAVRFLEIVRLNSGIAGLLAAPVPDEAMVELVRADIEKGLTAHPPSTDVRLRIAERAQPPVGTPPTLVSAPSPQPARRNSAFRALAWAAVFVAFVGLAAFFLLNRTRAAEGPVVTSIEGEVRLTGPTGERLPTLGDAWQQNEMLKTVGPNSGVALKLRDGSQLIFSNSAIAVKEPSIHGSRIRLEHGVLLAAVKKHSVSAPFIFVTPEAEAFVVGTAFRLISGGHNTRLEVTEGEVRFRRRHDGAEVAVKAGFFAVVGPNVPLVANPIHGDRHHTQ